MTAQMNIWQEMAEIKAGQNTVIKHKIKANTNNLLATHMMPTNVPAKSFKQQKTGSLFNPTSSLVETHSQHLINGLIEVR